MILLKNLQNLSALQSYDLHFLSTARWKTHSIIQYKTNLVYPDAVQSSLKCRSQTKFENRCNKMQQKPICCYCKSRYPLRIRYHKTHTNHKYTKHVSIRSHMALNVFTRLLDWRHAVKITQVQRWSRGHKARGQGQGHKKIRGQGQEQPFRGQNLSRPRTGMLEAKAKDQGHKRKCSPKKKGLYKNFLSDLHKKTFSKNFFKRSTKF